MAGDATIGRMVEILKREVEGENAKQADSWKRMQAAFTAFADAVQRHAQALEDKWPRTNKASEAFLVHIDQLVTPLQDAAMVAAPYNAQAVSTIETVAKQALSSMQSMYARSATINQNFEALAQQPTPSDATEIMLMKQQMATGRMANNVLDGYKTDVAQTPMAAVPSYTPPLPPGTYAPPQVGGNAGGGAAAGPVSTIPGGGGGLPAPVSPPVGGIGGPGLGGGVVTPVPGGSPPGGLVPQPSVGPGAPVAVPIVPPIGGGGPGPAGSPGRGQVGGIPVGEIPVGGSPGGGTRIGGPAEGAVGAVPAPRPGGGVMPIEGGLGVGRGVPPVIGGTPGRVGQGGGLPRTPGAAPPVVGGRPVAPIEELGAMRGIGAGGVGGAGGTAGGARPAGGGVRGATEPAGGARGAGGARSVGGVRGAGGVGEPVGGARGVGGVAGGAAGSRPGVRGVTEPAGGARGAGGAAGGGRGAGGVGGARGVGGAAGGAGSARPGAGASGRRARRAGAEEKQDLVRGYENDELWTIPQGAPDVVEPSGETYKPDPGPAVGR
jgi:hypothetical protein